MRSFFAILAGFVTVFIVSRCCDLAFHGIHPSYNPPVIVSWKVALVVLVYGIFSIVIGGYLTGLISRKHYVLNGLILGVLGLIISIYVDVKTWTMTPVWFHILGLVLTVPFAAYGAHLAGQRQQRKAAMAAAV